MSWWQCLIFWRRPVRQTSWPQTPEGQARALIAALDRGGVPLNTLQINHLARALGLEVSRKARPEETIARIRAAVARLPTE